MYVLTLSLENEPASFGFPLRILYKTKIAEGEKEVYILFMFTLAVL